MSKHDSQARPIYHRNRKPAPAHWPRLSTTRAAGGWQVIDYRRSVKLKSPDVFPVRQ